MKTSHFASPVIIFRNSWGNSQAKPETIFCLIGKWSLGNEIGWCPVTHLLSSPSDRNRSFLYGLPKVQLFVFWRNMRDLDFSKQPSLHRVLVLLVCTLRPSAWLHNSFSSSFFIALLPFLFSPLLLITLTSFSTIISFPLLLHRGHTQNLSFLQSFFFFFKCLSSGGRHVQGGGKNAKYHLSRIFPRRICLYFTSVELLKAHAHL